MYFMGIIAYKLTQNKSYQQNITGKIASSNEDLISKVY